MRQTVHLFSAKTSVFPSSHFDTHEKHLSVLDYKKQEREKEVAVLGAKIEQKQVELESLSNRVLNYDKAKDELSNLEFELDTAPKYQLPEPYI